jgi:signal transduction histidine kinase
MHVACCVLFLVFAKPALRYAEPPAVYFLFLSASAALAVGMYLVRRAIHFRGLLLARLAVFLFLNAPFRGYLEIRLLLVVVLFLEIGISESFPVNLLWASLAFATNVVAVALGMDRAMGPSDRGHDLVVFCLAGAAAAANACLLGSYRERMALYGRETEKLGAAAEELIRAQMGYLEYARSAEQRSKQSERNRLSAELHDSLGYTFTNLRMMIEAAKDLLAVDPDKLRELLHSAVEQVEQGMTETRKALYKVRETREAPPPFLTLVHRMVEVFRKATGVDVVVDYANFPVDTDDEVESALYHFIQEGLVNSFSHGRASSIRVALWSDDELLQVIVEDDGVGIGMVKEGIGIRGMRERLGSLGGTLSLRNTPGGFQIRAQVPVREEPWKG